MVIISSNPQKDGRCSIREVHTDHMGKEYWFQYKAMPKTDINAVMLSRIPRLELDIQEREMEEAISRVLDDGQLPTAITLHYNTLADFKTNLLSEFEVRKTEANARVAFLAEIEIAINDIGK